MENSKSARSCCRDTNMLKNRSFSDQDKVYDTQFQLKILACLDSSDRFVYSPSVLNLMATGKQSSILYQGHWISSLSTCTIDSDRFTMVQGYDLSYQYSTINGIVVTKLKNDLRLMGLLSPARTPIRSGIVTLARYLTFALECKDLNM